MSEDDFVNKFSGASFDVEELAEAASEVDGNLGQVAKDFLVAYNKLYNCLDEVGYELG